MIENSSVLVTGGAGFIGSHLTEHLVELGADVTVADDLSRGTAENLAPVIDDITLRGVDLTTYKNCIEVTRDVDHVFHLAASVGGIQYIDRENIGGLTPSVLMNQHLLEAARVNDVDRVLFASSACIYRQEHDDLNLFEEEQAIPANPHSTYGWAKILGEIACKAYHTDSEVNTGMVRIFNSYGPRETLDPDSSHVIPSLCRKVIEATDGDSIELFGDGSQERGFIYVEDLVEGMVRALEHKSDGDPINLGNAKEVVTINELARKIIEISGKDLSIEHDLSKPTGTDKYAADMEKMRTSLGWDPTTALDDGLRRTYQWAEGELTDGKPIRQTVGGDS